MSHPPGPPPPDPVYQMLLQGIIPVAPAATWPFTVMSTLLVAIRAWSRATSKDSLGWHDVAIYLAWALDITRQSLFQNAIDLTKQINPAVPATLSRAAEWTVIADSVSFVSITVPKLGVALLLIHILRPRAFMRAVLLFLSITLVILGIPGLIITFVQCNPVQGQWDPFNYPNAVCWSRDVQVIYATTVSAYSALIDLVFAVYPGIVIWQLQMLMWKRLGVMALMGLGLASFAFALVKLNSLLLLFNALDPSALLYISIYSGIWTSIENDFVLAAACLPAAPPFFRAAKVFTSSQLSRISRSRTSASSSGLSGSEFTSKSKLDSKLDSSYTIRRDETYQLSYEHQERPYEMLDQYKYNR